MSRVNISQASRLTGKSRTTIHRKLKSGELSIQNGLIDTSELIRVFGQLVTNDTSVPKPKKNTDDTLAVQQASDNLALKREIELLKRMVEGLEQDKADLKADKQSLQRLLEHRPNVSENSPANMSEKSANNSENSDYSAKKDWKEQREKEGRAMKLARFIFDK